MTERNVNMKVVVITGASSGIGLETAKLFSKNGFRVYALSRRGGTDSEIINLKCDVTNENQVKETFAEIYEKEGRIDILVNNAGFGISGAIEFTDEAQAKKQFDVNFFGTFNCSKAVTEYMRKNGGGRIINISSMAAPLAIPFQAFYSASKAAVNSFTLALANEVKPFGISVCALMPGDVKTGFTAVREKETAGESVYGDTIRKSIATMEHDEQNGMSAADIAKAVLRLAKKKKPKPISTTGAQYKLIAGLAKIVPASVANKIVSKIYT